MREAVPGMYSWQLVASVVTPSYSYPTAQCAVSCAWTGEKLYLVSACTNLMGSV
ncbi:hypothetical protein BDQ94DRAFT_8520 [Aspergillus welwitschiae]|uniref:Uncharacterized protein n=1 Tax=Aspergillus welwitschiae TaxID=1341132 RepID=A0A3F3QKV0_9EURO|nr:hypothetical protein BDQ94DRAFT_8520 [Aspergillus welwitschiae]RDH39767.1 hypothetical protein BDQ94DRAFT_8520 [Aspergillus welwitschiae]